jgi:hypothetical protein
VGQSRSYFVGIIVAVSRETQQDEDYPATIFFELVLTGTLLWAWARYHDIASTAISAKARMIKQARI